MREPLKTTLASLMSLALLPMAASAAYTVGSPHPGTVTATTYYSSGAFHGAVDISGDGCGVELVHAALRGMLYWEMTIRTTGKVCYGSGSGTQNEVKHTFASGYVFRQWHFIYDPALPKSQTCDRCAIGRLGGTGNATSPHTHLQWDKLGTNSTSWYAGTVKGEFLDLDEVIGTVG